MSDNPAAGLLAPAHNEVPVKLAYAAVPRWVPCEATANSYRLALPLTAEVRRAFIWTWLWRIGPAFAVPLLLAVACARHSAHRFVALVTLATLLGLIALLIWAASRRLRSRTIDVTADRLILAPLGREPDWRLRTHARGVRVRRVPCLDRATVDVTTRHGESLIVVWYGQVAEVERVAAELRAALGLPPAANKAADVIGGPPPCPPMPSGALFR